MPFAFLNSYKFSAYSLDFSEFKKSDFNVAEHFRKHSIEFEYCDEDYVVLMVTAQNSDEDFERLKRAIINLPELIKNENCNEFKFVNGNQKMSIRDAIFSKSQEIPVEDAIGKICATPTVSCPPAIPIVVSGEEISEEHVELLKRYGKESIRVLSEK